MKDKTSITWPGGYTSVLLFALFAEVTFGSEPLAYVPGSTKRVCQLTGDMDRASGKLTLNQTNKSFGVWGTDLGSSFEHKGKLYFLFGDTIGRPGDRDVLAWTESRNPERIPLHFHRAADRKWLPLTVPGISQGAFEVPSAGISCDGKMYVVCTTGHNEKKTMGRSVLTRSDDDGKTFKKLHLLSHDKFINVSFWPTEKWLYIFGSGDYRKSNVFLARVPPNQLEDQSKMTFFAGGDEEPQWSPKESDVMPLFNQPQVGEFSVRFLAPVDQYAIVYNAKKPRGINLRSAPNPWGPWSKETVIFDPWNDDGYGQFIHVSSKSKQKQDALSDPKRKEEWGGEYGPYIIHRFTKAVAGNCRIFYTLSTWNPYQVMIMQTDLKVPKPQGEERIAEKGNKPPGGIAFEANTTWANPTWTMTVTWRSGEKFKATYTFRGNMLAVTGTINGDRISWRGKDVRILKGRVGADDHQGTLVTTEEGDKIHFRSRNGRQTFNWTVDRQ